jgi:D-amino-acid dehydrogenase
MNTCIYIYEQVHTDGGWFECDANTEVIVAAGSWTPNLLWTAGLYMPIYPLKGYSITMDLPDTDSKSPTTPTRLPESDLVQRIVADQYIYGTRLGQQIRVASMGEFDGWNSTPTEHVDQTFRAEAAKKFPRMLGMMQNTPTRCGLRPFSADGVVLLGRLPQLDNCAVSVGPGFNGWKTAVGSANVLVDRLEHHSKHTVYDDFDAASLEPKGVKNAPILSRLALARHMPLKFKDLIPETLAKWF